MRVGDARFEKPLRGPGPRETLLFPRGVTLWHFVLAPPAAMALFVLLARLVDPAVRAAVSPGGYAAYSVVRASGISLAMAALIAYLAFRHRREYEAKLLEHNRALEQTRDFLSRILESSAEAIVTVDPELRITSWNLAAERTFGWTAEEVVGRDCRILVPQEPEALADFERHEAVVRSGQSLRDHEVVRVHKDGRRLDVRVTCWPIFDGAGSYLGNTGILRDISALKEMEAKLVEAERLAAVGELAASVAHEIKNPLAGIRGACELLSDVFGPDDPRRELSAEVHRQIERLDGTLKDLLRFARPQATRMERADIHRVIEHVLAVMQGDSRLRGIEFERRFDPAMPEIDLDPQQMEQVFFNVLLNACQAAGDSGRVVIATEAEPEAVRIRIRDTGPGIPQNIFDKIFNPFFTTRAKGTGLGLAIVRNIVRAHGGTIAAANVPDGGAEIAISLRRGV